MLYARDERVREGGAIARQAVLIAGAAEGEGRRQSLAAKPQRESPSSRRDFLLRLKKRGLSGVAGVVSDDHAGLKAAIREVLPEAWGPRRAARFLRPARDAV
ncbi:MAG: transposase, partial [Methylocella sp.]